MLQNFPGRGLWAIASLLVCCFFLGNSPVLASGALIAPAGSGPEALGISSGQSELSPQSAGLTSPEELLRYECIFEVKGVPRDLVVPWLLTPIEDYFPGVLVADPSLRRALEQAGVEMRLLGKYVATNAYYLVKAPPFVSERTLSGMGEILWGSGNTYLLAANVDLRDRGTVLGVGVKLLRPIMRSLSSMAPKPSPGTAAPLSYSETEDLLIDGMLEQVSEDRILTDLKRLTGEVEVLLSEGPSTINTRYSYHPDCYKAAEYIYSQFDSMGLDVAYDYYPGIGFWNVAFMGLNGYASGNEGTIYHTTDGGDTWEQQDSGTFIDLLAASFVAPDTGWMCGEEGTVIRTLDGGTTWEVMGKVRSVWLWGIDFVNSQTGWVLEYTGAVQKTTDGGLNWTKQKTLAHTTIRNIDFVDTQCGWAVGELGTILHTVNGGKKWELQTSNTEAGLHDLCFIDSLHGWAVGTSGVVLHTDDGGASWVAQSSGVTAVLLSVTFIDSLHGWASGIAGTVISTTDGGVTWDVRQTPAWLSSFDLRDICFIDTLHGCAATNAGIFVTEDGGESWELPAGKDLQWRNVVATLPGVENPSEEYIVCAHYDDLSDEPMVDAPGADDNGTGTAVVLEAARILKHSSFGSTIKFVCFSGEEQSIVGSSHYADEASLAGDNIAGVLNFDMVGYGTPSIQLFGDPTSEWLVDYCVSAGNYFVPSLGLVKIIDPMWLFSDHAAFWAEGYSALTGIEVGGATTHFYHTTSDTVGTLTIPFTADVTRLAIASLATLAGLDTTTTVLPVATVAENISLGAGYPNPLNPGTSICFSLPGTERAINYSLAIMDPEA